MKGWIELPPPISSDITARNFRPRYSSIICDGERHRLGIGEALLADQRRAHVGDDGHEVVVRELGGIHQLHTTPPR